MSDTDDIHDAIQASIANFTQRFEEVSSDQFNEMRKCSFFDLFPSAILAQLAQSSELRTFAAGEHITTEGDKMNAFHVLMFGTATAYVHDKVVGIIHSGECIGEGTFFSNEKFLRSATVIADGEVIALEVRKSIVDRMEGELKACMDKALLLALFMKLQAANKKIAELLKDQSFDSLPG